MFSSWAKSCVLRIGCEHCGRRRAESYICSFPPPPSITSLTITRVARNREGVHTHTEVIAGCLLQRWQGSRAPKSAFISMVPAKRSLQKYLFFSNPKIFCNSALFPTAGANWPAFTTWVGLLCSQGEWDSALLLALIHQGELGRRVLKQANLIISVHLKTVHPIKMILEILWSVRGVVRGRNWYRRPLLLPLVTPLLLLLLLLLTYHSSTTLISILKNIYKSLPTFGPVSNTWQ